MLMSARSAAPGGARVESQTAAYRFHQRRAAPLRRPVACRSLRGEEGDFRRKPAVSGLYKMLEKPVVVGSEHGEVRAAGRHLRPL
jgi:hypothetical protein